MEEEITLSETEIIESDDETGILNKITINLTPKPLRIQQHQEDEDKMEIDNEEISCSQSSQWKYQEPNHIDALLKDENAESLSLVKQLTVLNTKINSSMMNYLLKEYIVV